MAFIQTARTQKSHRDSDGIRMNRVKMFKSGVADRFHFFSYETSQLNSLHHKDFNDSDLNWITIKCYDDQDVELTTQVSCDTDAVKTVIDWEPTSINYEIISGTLYQDITPSVNIYMWVIGVPDIPAASGGEIPFCNGADLCMMPDKKAFEADGRVPKYMTYHATLHTSKFRFILRHPAGHKHKMMGEFEIAY